VRIFRFVQGNDSAWRKDALEAEDIETQCSKMMHVLGVEVIYGLHPQAKEKEV
jgi:hypothetical protein